MVACTRLASLLPLLNFHFLDNHDIIIEIFDVGIEPKSFEEYSNTVRLLAPLVTPPMVTTSEPNWEYLKFVRQGKEAPIFINGINPKKDTLCMLFNREAISPPTSFKFDNEFLNPNAPLSSLDLEDGDSVEIYS